MYYEINEESARRAHDNMSFSDYKPGTVTAEYRAAVDRAEQLAERQKTRVSPFYHDKIDNLLDAYARRLAEYYNRESEIGTRCASVMIAGPANFPVRKKEKQVQAWNANRENYLYCESLLDKIKGTGTGAVDLADPHAAEILRYQLEKAQGYLDTCKGINAFWRKNNTLAGCPLIDAAQAAHITAELSDPQSYSYNRKPCPDYELTSIRGKIKRLQARLDELQKRQDAAPQEITTASGVQYIENTEADRVQLIFPDKPDEETRAMLKSNGFRWSPRFGAWQRQLTENGKRAARAILAKLEH